MNRSGPPQSRRDFLAISSLGALGILSLSGGVPGCADPSQTAARLAPAAGDGWHTLRRRFLIEDGLAYLNTGTYGPSLRDVVATESRLREEMNLNFNRFFYERLIQDPFPALIERIAAFVGAGPDEIAFTSGATESMNYIASGLDLREGDEVLTTTHEHPAGIYPWQLLARRRGIRVRQLPMPVPPRDPGQVVDLFEGAITTRTRLLSFCHVQYTDGTLLPVRELCDLARSRGILTVVDGAQSVGMLDFAIRDVGCDYFACSLHKWLGGPYGTGLLYAREEMLDRLWPTVVEGHDGWDAMNRFGERATRVARDFAETWPRAMQKLAVNVHYYAPLFWALVPALELHETLGRPAVESRIRELAAAAAAGLREIPGVRLLSPDRPDLSSGIVSFRLEGTEVKPFALELSREHRIVIRAVDHGPFGFAANRICTHIFNDEEDLERLFEVLRARRPR